MDWKGKIRTDAAKLAKRAAELTYLVFATNRRARGVDVDSLRAEIRSRYGWTLIVYSREWLRLQLEEVNPDLAKRHLNIDVPPSPKQLFWLADSGLPSEGQLKIAIDAIEVGAFERAIDLLRKYLDVKPESGLAWQLLAWSNYRLDRFDESLSHINRALKLDQNARYQPVKACILAEKGIRDKSKAELLLAEKLFKEQLGVGKARTWHVFYNLGNVLSALGKHSEAIEQFKSAVKLESRRPEVWKNLGSAYHEFGDHASEMKCFDRALELDPLKPEALISKAVSLITDLGKPSEAIPLLEAALRFSPDVAVRWPRVWYWLAKAWEQKGSPANALAWIEEGLAQKPGARYMKHLKSKLLADLQLSDQSLARIALEFWKDELQAEPLNYEARAQLAKAELLAGNEAAAWAVVEDCFHLFEFVPVVSLKNIGFTVAQCIDALRFLPQYASFRKSHPVSAYWELEGDLYDLGFAPPRADRIQATLTIFLAIPFGIGVRYLQDCPRPQAPLELLVPFFDALREPISVVIVESTREYASLISSRDMGVESVSQKIAEAALFLGLVALCEFSRQRAWITGYFNIPSDSLSAAMENYDEVEIQRSVISQSAGRLAKESGLIAD
jgi:tetratricopeptide (TPR) repeat protein